MNRKLIGTILVMIILSIAIFSSCISISDGQAESQDMTQINILKKLTDISQIPRCNDGDMSDISKYINEQAKDMGLKSSTDKYGNILIEKPATSGYENAPVTILQTNMDMIAEASPSVIFDSDNDGITPIVNEDTGMIKGDSTSLGASSGIGMATAFYVLENSSSSGAIKAVFTVDGKGDMTGAKNIDESFIDGDYLINLNNDSGNSINTGSAYSSVLTCSEEITKVDTRNEYSFVIVADDFSGGNSGLNSQNDHGNPIMFIAEVLAMAKNEGFAFELNDIVSSDDNVFTIPESAKAVITANEYEKNKIISIFNNVKNSYLKEHSESDPNAKLEIIETTVPDQALAEEDTNSLISFLYSIIDGKYNDEDTGDASSCTGTIKIENNRIICGIFAQTESEAELNQIINDHSQIAKISDITIEINDNVSGYSTDAESYLPASMLDIYESELKNDVDMGYKATRTELGFFKEKNADLEIISIGPTIGHQNSVDEYAELETVDMPAKAVLSFLSGLNNK